MVISECLNKVREKDTDAVLNVKHAVIRVLSFFIFGIVMGFIAKYIDEIHYSNGFGSCIHMLARVGSRIGVWAFIAAIIASFSKTAKAGAIHVFAFFIGMLVTYYIYEMELFGFFPTYYFLRWGLIALVSPIGAYIVWFGRGRGWIAALCAALPIAFLFTQGYRFLFTFRAVIGFDFFCAIILLFVLPKEKYQYLKVLPIAIILAVLIYNSPLLNLVFGGL